MQFYISNLLSIHQFRHQNIKICLKSFGFLKNIWSLPFLELIFQEELHLKFLFIIERSSWVFFTNERAEVLIAKHWKNNIFFHERNLKILKNPIISVKSNNLNFQIVFNSSRYRLKNILSYFHLRFKMKRFL